MPPPSSFRGSLLLCVLAVSLISVCHAEDPLPTCVGFSVGSEYKSKMSDVVAEGRAVGGWSPLSATKEKREASDLFTDFYITYPAELYNLSLTNVKLNVSLASLLRPNAELTGPDQSNITTLRLTYECLPKEGGGLSIVNVTLVFSSCAPITFEWIKTCGQPGLYRKGFIVGTAPGTADVVKDGVATDLYDDDGHPFRVPPSVPYSNFYIRFQGEAPPSGGGAPAAQPFSRPKINADENVVYPVMLGDGYVDGEASIMPKALTVVYNCHGSGHAKVEVIIPLPHFKDVFFTLIKDCSYEGSVASSWSTAAKTFFVFSVCLVALMVVGCGYKYQKGSRGLEVVPFIDEIRGFVDWAKDRLSSSDNIWKRPAGYRDTVSHVDDDLEEDVKEVEITERQTTSVSSAPPSSAPSSSSAVASSSTPSYGSI